MVRRFGWRGFVSLMTGAKCVEVRRGGDCGHSVGRGNCLGAD